MERLMDLAGLKEDLRGAITVLEDRLASWNTSHPVQGDLCNGLVKLEKLATWVKCWIGVIEYAADADGRSSAATQQRTSPTTGMVKAHDRNRLTVHWQPTDTNPIAGPGNTSIRPGRAGLTINPNFPLPHATPLSQIRGFPEITSTSPGPTSASSADTARQTSPMLNAQQFVPSESFTLPGDGFNGSETLALPQVSCHLLTSTHLNHY